METIHRKHYVSNKPCVNYMVPALPDRRNATSHRRCPLHAAGLSKARLNRRVYTEILHIITTYKGFIIGDSSQRCIGIRLHAILQVDSPERPYTSENTNPNKPYPNCRPTNATHRSPPKLVNQSEGWNNAKEQICNQCTSRLSRYLWFTYESGGIFPTSSAVARSRFSAGVAITNISMQLALLRSELDYLTYNWTSRHGTGYTFTWPRPTVEPLWIHVWRTAGAQRNQPSVSLI